MQNNPSVTFDNLGLWFATDDSAEKSRRIYVAEQGDTKSDLADILGLDVTEFDKWAIPDCRKKLVMIYIAVIRYPIHGLLDNCYLAMDLFK